MVLVEKTNKVAFGIKVYYYILLKLEMRKASQHQQ